MWRTITILCLIAVPAFEAREGSIQVKFDGDVSRIRIDAYFGLPQSQVAAVSGGIPMALPALPDRPADMSYVMWCARDGNKACVLTDSTGRVVNMPGTFPATDQAPFIPRPDSSFQGSAISESTFSNQRPPSSIKTYSPGDLIGLTANYQATRIPLLNPGSRLPEKGTLDSIFNNEIYANTNSARENGAKTDFTNQACITKRGLHEKGLVARFDGDISRVGKTAFFDLPQSATEAAAQGWVQVPRPPGPVEMSSLIMWCPRDDYSVCVFTDDTGYIAGTQTSMDEDRFTDAILDWRTQGYTYWPVQVNGVKKNYWTAQQYYMTPALLAMDPATRIARRNPNTLLQDDAVLVSGFNGELIPITTNACDIISGRTEFTKQACVDKMGYHYYYKLTNMTDCTSDQLLPWLPLIDNNELIGVTMAFYSKHRSPREGRQWFEIIDSALFKAVIPNGPECLYGLPKKSERITLHTYFIKRPYDIKC